MNSNNSEYTQSIFVKIGNNIYFKNEYNILWDTLTEELVGKWNEETNKIEDIEDDDDWWKWAMYLMYGTTEPQ